jgi:FkbM family methyltransferase
MSLTSTLRFIIQHPLNKKRKIKALANFARWQISSRFCPGAIIYNWVGGARVIVQAGETGFTQNIYCGLHEYTDMAYVLHVMNEDDLFIDVGANIGSYTILACAVKGAKGFCFEPIPITYLRLLDNIRLNNLETRVNVLNVGVSDNEGELIFTTGENCTNHVLAEGEVSGLTKSIKVLPLDKILINQCPSLIKIDVEGFETRVINGANQVLECKSLHSVIMELNGSGKRYLFNEKPILNKMLEYGFKPYKYNPEKREIIRIEQKNDKSGNTIFIRDEILVKEKLYKSAPILMNNKVLI